jgi:pimeloyl-ACP methyl ester carboxylesterase
MISDNVKRIENAPKRAYASTRLGQLHYISVGDTSLPTLLLLPPAGRTSSVFLGLARILGNDFHVVAIDYPGSGSSDPFPQGTSILDLAGVVVDLQDQLSVARAHVYGINAGNKVAAALGAHWPQRLSKLIFVGQSHSIVPSNAERLGTVGKTRVKLLHAADERESALVQWADMFNTISASWWNEALVRSIADPALRRHAISLVTDELLAAESLPEFYRAIRGFDLEGDLKKIVAPTLVIELATPSEDIRIGRQGEKVLKSIANARLVTFVEPDFHGITLENKPEEVATVLRKFLL